MIDIKPTPRELEPLKVLWGRGRATVREVHDRLKSGERKLAYTTTLSLLQTMEGKGLVGHKSAGKAYASFAEVPRAAVLDRLAGGFLTEVLDGAMGEYVARAIESRLPSVASWRSWNC